MASLLTIFSYEENMKPSKNSISLSIIKPIQTI